MTTFAVTRAVLNTAILAGVFAATCNAQATRTWVSGVGNDANPCSRTAPCKTFAGAISKTAAGGEINCLDPGGFGAVTITKAMTIDCRGTMGHILASLVNGIVINAGANDTINIRYLDINGIGNGLNGIRYLAGRALHVENVRINGFTQTCIDASTSVLSSLRVQDVTLSECGAAGISLTNSAGTLTADISNTRVARSNFGVRGNGGAVGHIRSSFFSFNTVGVGQNAAGSVLSVTSSQFDGNGVGVQSLGAAAIHLFGNTFGSNSTAINLNGGSIFSDGQNGMVANGANGAVSGATTKI